MDKKITDKLSTTFAEYLLIPSLSKKEHYADNVSLKTSLVRYKKGEQSKISLNLPFTSSIMQAVSGQAMAIALAREGGVSFIFCSQPIEDQAKMVEQVKHHKAGFVESKANLSPDHTLQDAINLTKETGYSTIAITKDGNANSELLGLLTDQDYWIDYDSTETKLKDLMTPFKEIVYCLEGVGLDEANTLLRKSKKSCIPVINNKKEKILKNLVFKKDREQHREHSLELVDSQKRMVVGAGVNTRDYKERIPALVNAGVDVLSVDTSDGYSEYVKDVILWTKENYPNLPIGAGNVVNGDGFKYLADAGADFVKVGIGGGSICITQEVKGLGRGQVSALIEVVQARDEYLKETEIYVPVCSDGGLVQDSHILISLALGADFVMMGRYFARCEESPTEKKMGDELGLVKPYWGEGSARAKNWQRYHASDEKKLPFEEGVDGWVPYAGNLNNVISKTVKIIKSTMCNLGCLNINELHQKAILERRSPSSIREGKPHDIQIHSDSLGGYEKMFWGN